jgi:sensor histidine kinase regulating citrate/malate metabolism
MTILVETNQACGPSLAAQAALVTSLCDQRRHQMARLRSISSSLDGNDTTVVLRLAAGFEQDFAGSYPAVARRIEFRRIASLLSGKAAIAHQSGIRLTLDPAISLRRLPAALTETQAVSLVGNLLDNAFDAVARMRGPRRRVDLLLNDTGDRLQVRVRDWGPGLTGIAERQLLSPGFTTKPGHYGVGLAVVRALAEGAGGSLRIERPAAGTAFEVVIPYA